MQLQLNDILEEIGAKTIPVHTENAELFDKFMQDSKSKVLPARGRKRISTLNKFTAHSIANSIVLLYFWFKGSIIRLCSVLGFITYKFFN
ncbi:MAG: hypothetical protein QW791_07795 [Candidatus Bathyarchaeia archaeon]